MNLSIKNNYINRILERKKLLLWSIFALGLLLRIAFIILWDRRPNFDTQNYIAQAEGILNGNPVSGFPNGYPLIIAAVIFLTGKNLIFTAMILLNLIAQFLTGYFLYKISKLLFSESPNQSITQSSNNSINQSFNHSKTNHQSLTTTLVLFIFALYPTQILYTNSVLTEAITTLFITASVYGILSNAYFVGGFSFALATMLRTLYLPALAIIALYLIIRQRKNGIKYIIGSGIIIVVFALFDFTGITKFPTNQNYNLLIAINSRSSSINHNISNFSESDFGSPFQTYINFAHNNPKEFFIQRADALWGLWGVFPFETHHLYSKLLLSVRTLLFLSWIYWLYIFFRKKEISETTKIHQFLVLLTILITTITIIHTIYFSSFRFIVPIEPVLLILLVFTIIRFSTVNQSIIHSSNNQHPIPNTQ